MSPSFRSNFEKWSLIVPVGLIVLIVGALVLKRVRGPKVDAGKPVAPVVLRVRPPASHAQQVRSLSFSPDGRWLASASGGLEHGAAWSEVALWALPGNKAAANVASTYNENKTARGPVPPANPLRRVAILLDQVQADAGAFGSGRVNAVAFAPDSEHLILAGDERHYDKNSYETLQGRIEVRGIPAGDVVQTLKLPAPVHAITVSPDGRWLATGEGSFGRGTVRLWEIGTKSEISDKHPGPGKFLRPRWAMPPGGKRRAVDPFSPAYKDESEVRALAFLPDSRGIVVQGVGSPLTTGSCGLRFRDVTTGRVTRRFPDGTRGNLNGDFAPYSIAVSPDGRLIAVNTFENELNFQGCTLYQVGTGRAFTMIYNSAIFTAALVFAPDGQSLISAGSYDPDIYSPSSNSPSLDSSSQPGRSPLSGATSSAQSEPSGEVNALRDGFTMTSQPQTSRPSISFSQPPINAPDWRGSIVTFDTIPSNVSRGRVFERDDAWSYTDPITTLALAPDGKTLALGTRGPHWGEIRLWDIRAAKARLANR